jgi:hypothetical protein
MLQQLEQALDERMSGLHCPVCLYPMKVNKDFKVAKCFKCDLTINWGSSFTLSMSLLGIAEVIARKRGIKLDALPTL